MKLSIGFLLPHVLAVVATFGLGMEVNTNSALSFDAEGAQTRPVSKVITLLKDMLKQLEKEAEEDEEVYEKMGCWCETNDKEKTKSIADAEARIETLTATIEEMTALSAKLNTEIKRLDKEVAEEQTALDKATSIRQKELAEFQEEEKDMLGTISSLKSAVTVLGKHNSMIQVQSSTSHVNEVAADIQNILQKHGDMLQSSLTQSERKVVSAFVQAYAAPGQGQSYAPQSGAIFGVLTEMKETFETNLAASQQEEATNAKAFEDLKAGKEEEITSGQAMIDKKTTELATADEKNAQAKEDLADTKETLAADEEFLAMLKEKCASMDAEFEERVKTRQLEMQSTSKALAILNSDEAHDTFGRTFSLVQTRNAPNSRRRTEASKVLSAAAKVNHNNRLAVLAYQVKVDPFVKVFAAIGKMIADIKKQKAEESHHMDFCRDELNTNQLQTEKKDREKQDLIALIEDLTNTIEVLTGQINTLKSEIDEAQVQIKRAGDDREYANKDFQAVVADQKATQELLKRALAALEGFYSKKEAAFVQGQQQQPAFKQYKKNAASGGVIGMLQDIINDAVAMEKDAIMGEEDAQKAYESFVKETNLTIEAKTKNMINKSEEKSKAEADKVLAEKELDSAMMELDSLAAYKGELHSSCDFVLKNFDASQAAKDGEIEALKQAIASMSGSTAF